MAKGFRKRDPVKELGKIAHMVDDQDPVIATRQVLAPAQEAPQNTLNLATTGFIEVPLSKFKANLFNARRTISQSKLDELAALMRRDGQAIAVLAYLEPDGTYRLIDGHRRHAAASIAGLEALRVELRPKPISDQDMYLASWSANTHRESQSPLDDAIAWKMLLDDGVFKSQSQLAASLNLNESLVSRTLALAELPKLLIGMLVERPTLTNLRMLTAINLYYKDAGDEKTESLILDIIKADMSSRDVDKARQALSKVPVTRKRSAMQEVKYEQGKSTMKRFDGQGRLNIEVKDVKDEETIDKIQKAISGILENLLHAKA